MRPPSHWIVGGALLGGSVGAVFGLVRGFDRPATVLAAIAEGSLIFSVPGILLGVVVAAVVALGRVLHR